MSDPANTATGFTTIPQSRDFRVRWWFFLLAAAVLLVIGYVSTRIFGAVYGEEFSPSTFQRRRFSYYEIPLVHLQITPISREDYSNTLETQLADEKLVLSGESHDARWDLVWARQGAQGPSYGDASILCAYLDARGEQQSLRWKTWTDENPELAKILWATVGRLADQQLYLLVPDVFGLAAQATEPSSFQQAVSDLLADRYELLARTQRELGDDPLARQLAQEGLHHDPNRQALKDIRAATGGSPSGSAGGK
jgi:hypothetical protein